MAMSCWYQRFNWNGLDSEENVKSIVQTNLTGICKYSPFIATSPPQVCSPNICGPYSVCHEKNQHPVCSCQPGYIGMPPNCRAECVVSSDCPQDKACYEQKCGNPCTPGTCAHNAICKVVNHNPICSCSKGFTGNPFEQCIKIQSKINQPPLPFNQYSNQSPILWIEFCASNHISEMNQKSKEKPQSERKILFSIFSLPRILSPKTQNFNHEKNESHWFRNKPVNVTPLK